MSLYRVLRIMTGYILRAYHLPGPVASALGVLPPLFLTISDRGGVVPLHGGGDRSAWKVLAEAGADWHGLGWGGAPAGAGLSSSGFFPTRGVSSGRQLSQRLSACAAPWGLWTVVSVAGPWVPAVS